MDGLEVAGPACELVASRVPVLAAACRGQPHRDTASSLAVQAAAQPVPVVRLSECPRDAFLAAF